jgi:thioredoxin reductase
MPSRIVLPMNRPSPMSIRVDGKEVEVYPGETLAAAIMNEFGIGYRETLNGEKRGPVCQMGVCYECSVHVNGLGKVRACMTTVEDGMEIKTREDGNSSAFVDDYAVKIPTVLPQMHDADTSTEPYDVIIIGAGPAGMGAADELAGHDLRIVVLDEQAQAGGQIYRRPLPEFQDEGSRNSRVDKATRHRDIDWVFRAQVWGIFPKMQDGKTSSSPEEAELFEICMEGKRSLLARRIILATGAYDRLVAFPGWQSPGVMSAGGIQLLLKSQGMLAGERIALAGSHPFLLIVAQQILKNGGQVTGITFAQPFPRIGDLIRYGVQSLKRVKKIKELLSALWMIRKANVPITYGRVPIQFQGNAEVQEATFAKVTDQHRVSPDDETKVECDVLGLCFGFNASSELARQVGCGMEYNLHKGGWIAKHNEVMQSTLPRVYVAGEITGVGGAELSELEGRLAGCGVLATSGAEQPAKIKKLMKAKKSWTGFADLLNEATALEPSVYRDLLRDPQTYICKCEQVTAGVVTETLEQHPYLETMNTIKLYTRCGMGLCQGRYCENTLAAFLHDPGKAVEVGSFTARNPVKPVSISELIKTYSYLDSGEVAGDTPPSTQSTE